VNAHRAGLEREVEALIRNLLRPKEGTPAPLCRPAVAEWDSLKHVEIVFALEDHFDVQFDESEFVLMDSAATISALLRERLEA